MWPLLSLSKSLSAPSEEQRHTWRQQMSSGMWAMMTLLEVLDWSFSDNLVHKFSAPGRKEEKKHPWRKSPVCDYDVWLRRVITALWYNRLPCSSLTAHTMRSTQAALAWQRSLRGLCSTGSPPVSWSTRCISDWLLLNCSSTKSWTCRTNAGCKAEEHGGFVSR